MKKTVNFSNGVLMLSVLWSSCATPFQVIQEGGRSYLLDKRDCRRYAITQVNGQWWMVDNSSYPFPGSRCYRHAYTNCQHIARVYNRKQAGVARPKGWRSRTLLWLLQICEKGKTEWHTAKTIKTKEEAT